MARGDKSKYTAAQKHKAAKIVETYENRGVDHQEAEARAWATVNKQDGGGEKAGSGRTRAPRKKAAARKDSAQRAVATRQRHSPNQGRPSKA